MHSPGPFHSPEPWHSPGPFHSPPPGHMHEPSPSPSPSPSPDPPPPAMEFTMTVTFAGTVEQFMPFKPMYEHGLRELLSCYEPMCKVAINVSPADPDPARPRAAEVAGVAERGERGGRHLQDDRRARGSHQRGGRDPA